MTASQLTECSHLEWRTTFGRWVRLDHVDHALKFILIALVDVMLPILLTWMTQLFLKCGISCLFSLTGWSHEERCIFFALLLRRDTEKLQVPKRILPLTVSEPGHTMVHIFQDVRNYKCQTLNYMEIVDVLLIWLAIRHVLSLT